MNAIALLVLVEAYYHEVVTTGDEVFSEPKRQAIKFLLEEDLVTKYPHTVTDRGNVHVRALLAALLPHGEWTSPLSKLS